MSGHRTSRFDPNPAPARRTPLRPYDRWQWLGLAAIVAGGGLFALHLAQTYGAAAGNTDTGSSPVFMVLAGAMLVNRRDPDIAPGTLGYSGRRWGLLILAGALAFTVFSLLPE